MSPRRKTFHQLTKMAGWHPLISLFDWVSISRIKGFSDIDIWRMMEYIKAHEAIKSYTVFQQVLWSKQSNWKFIFRQKWIKWSCSKVSIGSVRKSCPKICHPAWHRKCLWCVQLGSGPPPTIRAGTDGWPSPCSCSLASFFHCRCWRTSSLLPQFKRPWITYSSHSHAGRSHSKLSLFIANTTQFARISVFTRSSNAARCWTIALLAPTCAFTSRSFPSISLDGVRFWRRFSPHHRRSAIGCRPHCFHTLLLNGHRCMWLCWCCRLWAICA